MIVTLVRHAAAIDRKSGVAEEYRYLTDDGRRTFRQTAHTMLKNGAHPAVILTSPLVRAVQTAEILSGVLDFDGPLVVRKELEKRFQKKKMCNLIAEFKFGIEDEVILVGHDPDFSSLAADLLRNDGVSMKKGAALRLIVNPGAGPLSAEFAWMACGDKLFTTLDTAGGWK